MEANHPKYKIPGVGGQRGLFNSVPYPNIWHCVIGELPSYFDLNLMNLYYLYETMLVKTYKILPTPQSLIQINLTFSITSGFGK